MGATQVGEEASVIACALSCKAAIRQPCHCVQGKKVAVSGAGNVAIYTAEKLLEFGATVLTMSDSSGYVYFEKGITREQLTAVDTHKVANRGRLSDFKEGERCSWAGARSHGEACMAYIATQ